MFLTVFVESNWLCLVPIIEEISSKYGITARARWLDRHNINIHSQTPSWLPVFSKSFVLFCFFNSMKRCLLITRWDRVATRCNSSSGACWWQWGGLVLCAAAASVEWMQMRHHRYALRLHASTFTVSQPISFEVLRVRRHPAPFTMCT